MKIIFEFLIIIIMKKLIIYHQKYMIAITRVQFANRKSSVLQYVDRDLLPSNCLLYIWTITNNFTRFIWTINH